MPINLKDFDRKGRMLFNDIKKELNFKVQQIREWSPIILNKAVKDTLMKERRLRHVVPHVDKLPIKKNKIVDPVVGRGYAIKFRRKQQTLKLRMVVTRSNSTPRVFWSLAVAKSGRRALGPGDLSGRKKFFGLRLKPNEITSLTPDQIGRLKKEGNKVILPVTKVGPVKPYFDWIFFSEVRAFLLTKKFLKGLETGKTIRSI